MPDTMVNTFNSGTLGGWSRSTKSFNLSLSIKRVYSNIQYLCPTQRIFILALFFHHVCPFSFVKKTCSHKSQLNCPILECTLYIFKITLTTCLSKMVMQPTVVRNYTPRRTRDWEEDLSFISSCSGDTLNIVLEWSEYWPLEIIQLIVPLSEIINKDYCVSQLLVTMTKCLRVTKQKGNICLGSCVWGLYIWSTTSIVSGPMLRWVTLMGGTWENKASCFIVYRRKERGWVGILR